MKFNDFVYERPNLEEFKAFISEKVDLLNNASFLETVDIINEVEKRANEFDTMYNLCSIRNSINTVDEFYEKEMEFFDSNAPVFQNAMDQFNKKIVNSPYRLQLEEVFTHQHFTLLEMNIKTFDEKIMDDLVTEAKLCTEYSKVLASAKIEFDGKINNLSQMGAYSKNLDRNIRKEAEYKKVEFLESVSDKLDDIYDKLVKVRDNMAKKMGYKNYVEFGYLRLGRSDYNSVMVANYRDQVLKYVVPAAKKIVAAQARRIKLDDLKVYDIPVFYNDGNAKHGKNKDELVESALRFYSSLSSETKEFFEFMLEHDLMDLETKPNKAGGGYCTIINKYKAPFIFSNFNGTEGDVDVLTHEAGHAFQVYTASRTLPISDIYWPTLEACEIHSMSMEFFAYPYIDLFFGQDAKKYRFQHLSEAITFIPYGVCVDEFQHFVYENPNCSIKERKDKWRELEKKYTPWKEYDGIKYYESGSYWHRQGHIFTNAFYYIDYTLAQVCAFQFLLLDRENHEKAWQKYFDLCKLGGSKSFVALLEAVNLKNPFADGSLEAIMPKLVEILNDLENDLFGDK